MKAQFITLLISSHLGGHHQLELDCQFVTAVKNHGHTWCQAPGFKARTFFKFPANLVKPHSSFETEPRNLIDRLYL